MKLKVNKPINESKQIHELRTLIHRLVSESLRKPMNESGYHPATPKNIKSILDYMNSPSFKDFTNFVQNGYKSRTQGLEFNPKGSSDAIKQIFDGYKGTTKINIDLSYLTAASMPKEIKDLNNKYLYLNIYGHNPSISLALSNITMGGIARFPIEFKTLVLNNVSLVAPYINHVFKATQELYAKNVTFNGSGRFMRFYGNKVTATNINCLGELQIGVQSELVLNSIKTTDLDLYTTNSAVIKMVTYKNVSVSGKLTISDIILEKIVGAPKLTGNTDTDNAQLKKFFKVNNIDIVKTDRPTPTTPKFNAATLKNIKWELPENLDDMQYEYEDDLGGYSFSVEVVGTDSAGNKYTGTYDGILKSSDQDLDDRDFWGNIKFGPAQWKNIEDIEQVQ
jgi:hypothetical protein